MTSDKWITSGSVKKMMKPTQYFQPIYGFFTINHGLFLWLFSFIAFSSATLMIVGIQNALAGEASLFYQAITLMHATYVTVFLVALYWSIVKYRTKKVANHYGCSEARIRYIGRSLKDMGVRSPLRFIREHPEHLKAYNDIKKKTNTVWYSTTRDSMLVDYEYEHNAHLIGMLVFPTEDTLQTKDRVASIVEERRIADFATVQALLEEPQSPLSNGAL